MKKLSFLLILFSINLGYCTNTCYSPLLPHTESSSNEREFQNIYQCIGGTKLIQIVRGASTTTTTTASSTYQLTNLSVSLTPIIPGSLIVILVTGDIRNQNSSLTSAIATIKRDSTDLSTGSGFCTRTQGGTAIVLDDITSCPMLAFDTPGDQASHTYAVYLKSSDNVTNVRFLNSSNGSILAAEILLPSTH